MTPSERDLRAALRHGEGDELDPDAVVTAARIRGARRRTTALAVGGAAVVVAAVAATVAVVAGTQSHRDHGVASSPPAQCPTSFTQPARIGAASSAQLLPADTGTVLVCGYGSTSQGSSRPGQLTFSGAEARQLVASLDSASTTRPAGMCPLFRRADNHRLTFIADGDTAGAVSTTLGDAACSVVVSSAHAVRYAWTPPQALQVRLYALHP